MMKLLDIFPPFKEGILQHLNQTKSNTIIRLLALHYQATIQTKQSITQFYVYLSIHMFLHFTSIATIFCHNCLKYDIVYLISLENIPMLFCLKNILNSFFNTVYLIFCLIVYLFSYWLKNIILIIKLKQLHILNITKILAKWPRNYTNYEINCLLGKTLIL